MPDNDEVHSNGDTCPVAEGIEEYFLFISF